MKIGRIIRQRCDATEPFSYTLEIGKKRDNGITPATYMGLISVSFGLTMHSKDMAAANGRAASQSLLYCSLLVRLGHILL